MLGLITVPIANIYKDPNETSNLADEIFYGHIVTIVEVLEDYYYVKTEYDYFGYIEKSNIKITNEKRFFNTQTITASYIDVLSEPKYASHTIISLPRGAKVQVKEQANDLWSKVVLHNNKVGYIKTCKYKELNPLINGDPNIELDSNIRQRIVENAKMFMDANYRWGGKSVLGIDCSGLTQLSYMLEGIYIYRDAIWEPEIMKNFSMVEIKKEELKPADLIYLPGHVMMYMGDNKFIHSSSTQSGVTINSLDPNHEDYLEYLEKYDFTYIRFIHD